MNKKQKEISIDVGGEKKKYFFFFLLHETLCLINSYIIPLTEDEKN